MVYNTHTYTYNILKRTLIQITQISNYFSLMFVKLIIRTGISMHCHYSPSVLKRSPVNGTYFFPYYFEVVP